MKTKLTKKRIAIAVGVVIVALASYGIYSYVSNKPKEEAVVSIKPALTVQVKSPFYEKLPLKVDVTGNVLPWQEAIIGSEVAGMRIQSVLVDVGSTVKKGQVLATLNPETVQADYNQANSAYREAQAGAQEAIENANRARTLEKTSALSAQQMTQYLTAEKTAQARVASAKAALDSQRVRLNQTKIVAPDAGLVSARSASVGNLVGQNELFRIIIQEKLQWQPQITSDRIDMVQKNQEVDIKSKSGEIVKGKVTEISPIVNQQTRQGTVLVNLSKEEHQNKIKAGMFLEGSLYLGEIDAMLIDQQAVVLRDSFNYVFVLNSDNTITQTKVSLGMRTGNNIEIKSGIKPDDKIVVTGTSFLKDQDTVKVVEGK